MSYFHRLPILRTMCSLIRQRFSERVENGINKQINMELHASYVYLSMAFHFDRYDVALKGMYNYFKHSSDEELEHARIFMKYLNQRGGKIILENIDKPKITEWETAVDAMKLALKLEKDVNDSLLDLHVIGTEEGDSSFCDFLESTMLQSQVIAIKEIGGHVTNLERCGKGLGEFVYDKGIKFGDINDEKNTKN